VTVINTSFCLILQSYFHKILPSTGYQNVTHKKLVSVSLNQS